LLSRFVLIAAVVRRVTVMPGGHRVIIFGFLPQNLKMMAVAVAFSMAWLADSVEDGLGEARARRLLAGFRGDLYGCLVRRGDALLELADAVLCKQDRVLMVAELSLEPECRRGHGAVYDALNCGQVHARRLRRALAGLPLPAWDDGRIRLAVDVSNWLRPDAETSPERLFCHCYARGKGNAQFIPGWPYSLVAALERGRTSWTLPLDAIRLGPADDVTAVTAAQVREVVLRLIEAGHWREGGPPILAIFDSGYDLTRLAWLLADLPVEVMGRLRSDRVMYFPAPPRPARPASTGGRPPRHGAVLKLADPATWPAPALTTITQATRYGTATAMAWGRLHQRLATRAGWEDHHGELPVIEGTLIRLQVDHLPGQRNAEPLWLWSSRASTTAQEISRTWQAFLRRFDLEHTFRFLKQVLGWTRPKLRDPAAADRWTWLIIACYAQLYLARPLAADTRLPWQQPCPPARLTPARVRRGFRRTRQTLPDLASAPKPGKPGPGRPPGSKNHRPATRHNVGKTVTRAEPKKKTAGRQVK
jgi:DDE superfamily endonuclease